MYIYFLFTTFFLYLRLSSKRANVNLISFTNPEIEDFSISTLLLLLLLFRYHHSLVRFNCCFLSDDG